jgi:hypothetical protein
MRIPALLFLLLASAAHAADAWHTFTDKGGRKMVAAIVKVEDTYAILKLKANGREVTVGFDKLSAEDIEFLNSHEPGETPADSGKATEDDATEAEPELGRLYPRSKEEIRKTIREITSAATAAVTAPAMGHQASPTSGWAITRAGTLTTSRIGITKVQRARSGPPHGPE